ncbi:hypothetical protein NEOLI_000843 [Neolecta irregularis DAH-3]|uniref:Uncharacterized protein n=1 Tax=Neolecta irregularis (strain DAH-3) TaxID=1198029 RepID=A0A1U7LKY0_NEOID|nr:hypothetical protein NEOLI_000843 [Neolecta irregularis DAH-3]|eukprot:OLL23253.1 hypothetical protein NEOLI_000843 [Neolecta irregularis DAH-3]
MHDLSSQFTALSISYISKRNTKSPASFRKSLKKLKSNNFHARRLDRSNHASNLVTPHIPFQAAYIHILSKSQLSVLYSFNPKGKETKDHLHQNGEMFSHPVTAYIYRQAIKDITGRLAPAWVVKSITSQPIFHQKEQILRAAIILISRHSKGNYKLEYLVFTAVFISAKLFSPSQEYLSISLDLWSRVTRSSTKTIFRWEIAFLRDIDWNLHISREKWIVWEESWKRLESYAEPLLTG